MNGRAVTARTPLAAGDRIEHGETELVLEQTAETPARPQPVLPAGTPEQEVKSDGTGHTLPLYAAQTSLLELYSENMLQLAKKIQPRVLELLNVGNFSSAEMSKSEMHPRVEGAVDQILREVRHEIPAGVKLDQFRQILLDDLIGLGPLSPLLRDATISEIMINGPEKLFSSKAGSCSTGVRRNSTAKAICSRSSSALSNRWGATSTPPAR